MMPPRTVLAAIDFSDTSRVALVLAARLARHCQATLHVLHVEHPLLSAAATQAGIDLAAETGEELERFVAAAPPAATCAPQLHVVVGAAVDAILDAARRHHADVVVVGGRGMSGAERLVFGSTTQGLLRRSAVPILVAPADWAAPRPESSDLSGMGPVVAGVDPADSWMPAARAACALASALGAPVEIVHVVPNLSVPARWRAHADAALRDRLSAARRELEPLLSALGSAAPAHMRVESGDVAEQLVSLADGARNRAPLIVLGRKSSGSHGAPGAIAYRVISSAHVPVLMYVEA